MPIRRTPTGPGHKDQADAVYLAIRATDGNTVESITPGKHCSTSQQQQRSPIPTREMLRGSHTPY